MGVNIFEMFDEITALKNSFDAEIKIDNAFRMGGNATARWKPRGLTPYLKVTISFSIKKTGGCTD